MLCTKCGHEQPDDVAFCIQCGTSFALGESANVTSKAATPVTKKDYFANHCSASTKKKRKAIKILSVVSLAIQGVLAVLLIIGLGVLAHAIEQSPLFEGSASGAFGSLIAMGLFFTAGSFVFTILGIKKNSTGFFITATFFAFLSAAEGSMSFESLVLRQLISFGTLAIYIVIVVLNHQSNKEYKGYVSQYFTASKEYKRNASQCFATNKEGGLMKKVLFLIISLVLLCAFTASALSSCRAQSCHNCGDPVGSDPVKAGGRTYCSYDCYMDEVLFD